MTDNPMTAPPKLEPFTDIVFAAQTPAQGPDDMVFVEVEDHTGKSIKFGEWVKRPDGYWALRFKLAYGKERRTIVATEAAPKPTEHSGGDGGRRDGHSRLVYNKTTRSIDTVDPHPATPPSGDERAALADEDETYEIGKRDGYEDAIQDIDIATGGDGEFKGSSFPGSIVDVPAMKRRIIERFADALRVKHTSGEDAALKEIAEIAGALYSPAATPAADIYKQRLDRILAIALRAKHTSGPHSPAPGLSEEERRIFDQAIWHESQSVGGICIKELRAIIARITKSGENQ